MASTASVASVASTASISMSGWASVSKIESDTSTSTWLVGHLEKGKWKDKERKKRNMYVLPNKRIGSNKRTEWNTYWSHLHFEFEKKISPNILLEFFKNSDNISDVFSWKKHVEANFYTAHFSICFSELKLEFYCHLFSQSGSFNEFWWHLFKATLKSSTYFEFWIDSYALTQKKDDF